jgi:Domain of Unknown Function (DUF928)
MKLLNTTYMRWNQYLFAVVLTVGVMIPSFHTSVKAISIAQSGSDFDRYMRLGYQATARQDYRNALIFFRKANGIRPSNPYANQALTNVNRYINSKKRKSTWISSNSGAPTNRSSGATRDQTNCSNNTCLTALRPDNTDGKLTTVVEHPEILFYVNKIKALRMEFRLTDSVELKNYTTEIDTPKTASMIRVDLSKLKDSDGKALPPLKVGREYLWKFEIFNNLSDPNDRSNNPSLKGAILRQELEPSLAEMIKNASPIERISIYAFNNIWYDFVSLLYQEKLAHPTNQEILEKWNGLLEEIKLNSIVEK